MQFSPSLIRKSTIEPYPLTELYDYRIQGKIGGDGKGVFEYRCMRQEESPPEILEINFGENLCGDVDVDINVYDREPEAIQSLINKGLKDNNGQYLGKREARSLLKIFSGIGVYRNGFRIRPLGDSDFDWLELNKMRIQNPSMRIGTEQVIGIVKIQESEKSGLKEKSARDGLKNNKSYENLKANIKKIIRELENRRFSFRADRKLSRSKFDFLNTYEPSLSFVKIKDKIDEELKKESIKPEVREGILKLLSKKEEEDNKKETEFKEILAIYQAQATLGAIINVVLHEGRKPLNYFVNQAPNIKYWSEKLLTKYEESCLEKVVRISMGMEHNASFIASLFSKLDPLAAKKRGRKKKFRICDVIDIAISIFEEALRIERIEMKIECEDSIVISGWEQDFVIIFTNLIENSLFWIKEKDGEVKEIRIRVSDIDNEVDYIDYIDTGVGIDPKLTKSKDLFEPGFTMKPEGTGLGLTISGEAAKRNGFEIKILENKSGAYFRIEKVVENG